MSLYIARWPDGSAYLVKADSMAVVADILDEAGDPGACEVTPYSGPLVLEILPGSTREQELLIKESDCSDTGEAMRAALLRKAFPALYEALDDDDDDQWVSALIREKKRLLKPSSKWAAAVKAWWRDFGGPVSRTEDLRKEMRVTIPGIDKK